jgi:enterochelin esterase-like enzyme
MPFFELTGGPVLALSLVLLAAAVVAAVAVLPRHRGPGPGKYLLQAAALVVVTMLSMVALFLKLNADNQWYSSWSDLVAGDATGPVRTTVAGAFLQTPGREVAVSGGDFTALQRNPQSNPVFGAQVRRNAVDGQWVDFAFTGPTTGITRNVAVWLPPSYLTHPTQAYPVITAFSGFPGSPASYTRALRFDRIVQEQVGLGKLREPLVVVPDMYPANLDTECVDGSDGRYESYVAVDLVDWIRKNLRTVEDPRAWATTGYSAGGWCATMFSVLHPHRWAASINLAGYFAPDYSRGQRWDPVRDPRYDLGAVIAKQRPPVAIWFFSGGDDTVPLRSLAGFASKVRAPTTLISNISAFGGHRTAVWRPQMGKSLAWLGSISGYFAPG